MRSRFDPSPVVAEIERRAIGTRGVLGVCVKYGVGYRSYLRWKAGENQITWIKADEVACQLGMHVSELLGEAWWEPA